MFDITTARSISYGTDLAVTVFQDRTEKNIWYLVPVPRLRIQNGMPAFNLTKYNSNAGAVAGLCTFEVELHSPKEAIDAAKAAIPEIQGWGQFTWISGDARLSFDLGGTVMDVIQTPSLFGANVAHFQIELGTESEVNAFETAFKRPGETSPFRIFYDMGVLTQLLAAKATVTYKASAAIDYERKFSYEKSRWGTTTVRVEIKKILKESGAGNVVVTPGVGSTPELQQLVRDWAWTTLESQVATAVEAAQALAQDNMSPVSATSDFSANFSEDAIVEWSTPVSTFLPKFDDATWAKLYHTVDNRQLVVIFQLTGNACDDQGALLYESVEVTVDYPTKTTDNTFSLYPGTDERVAKTYVAPGGGQFDPTYKYKYTVKFPGDALPYTSEWITETKTQVNLSPNLFGVRNVTFYGSDVPFDKDVGKVKRVFIDFYDNPPFGQEPKLQTKEMRSNGTPLVFTTTYRVPLTNTYNYRLRYILANDTIVVVQPNQQFGSNNADSVAILDPKTFLANLGLRAITTTEGFISININAAFVDDQNSTPKSEPTYSWAWEPDPKVKFAIAETWAFDAQPDFQTAFFRLDGQIVYGDGTLFELSDFFLAYSKKPLILSDKEEIYSVAVITNQIDWATVALVTVNVFQIIDATRTIGGDAAVTADYLKPLAELEPRLAATIGETRTGLIPYQLLPTAEQVKALPVYYTLRKSRTASKVVFYYNADYVMRDGTVRSINDGTVEGKLQIILPPTPTAPTAGVIHRVSFATPKR